MGNVTNGMKRVGLQARRALERSAVPTEPRTPRLGTSGFRSQAGGPESTRTSLAGGTAPRNGMLSSRHSLSHALPPLPFNDSSARLSGPWESHDSLPAIAPGWDHASSHAQDVQSPTQGVQPSAVSIAADVQGEAPASPQAAPSILSEALPWPGSPRPGIRQLGTRPRPTVTRPVTGPQDAPARAASQATESAPGSAMSADRARALLARMQELEGDDTTSEAEASGSNPSQVSTDRARALVARMLELEAEGSSGSFSPLLPVGGLSRSARTLPGQEILASSPRESRQATPEGSPLAQSGSDGSQVSIDRARAMVARMLELEAEGSSGSFSPLLPVGGLSRSARTSPGQEIPASSPRQPSARQPSPRQATPEGSPPALSGFGGPIVRLEREEFAPEQTRTQMRAQARPNRLRAPGLPTVYESREDAASIQYSDVTMDSARARALLARMAEIEAESISPQSLHLGYPALRVPLPPSAGDTGGSPTASVHGAEDPGSARTATGNPLTTAFGGNVVRLGRDDEDQPVRGLGLSDLSVHSFPDRNWGGTGVDAELPAPELDAHGRTPAQAIAHDFRASQNPLPTTNDLPLVFGEDTGSDDGAHPSPSLEPVQQPLSPRQQAAEEDGPDVLLVPPQRRSQRGNVMLPAQE